jgi:hypothetical protein
MDIPDARTLQHQWLDGIPGRIDQRAMSFRFAMGRAGSCRSRGVATRQVDRVTLERRAEERVGGVAG